MAVVHELQHERDPERSEDGRRGIVKHEAKVFCCVSKRKNGSLLLCASRSFQGDTTIGESPAKAIPRVREKLTPVKRCLTLKKTKKCSTVLLPYHQSQPKTIASQAGFECEHFEAVDSSESLKDTAK